MFSWIFVNKHFLLKMSDRQKMTQNENEYTHMKKNAIFWFDNLINTNIQIWQKSCTNIQNPHKKLFSKILIKLNQ